MTIRDESNAIVLPIPAKAFNFARHISQCYENQALRHRVFFNAIALVIIHNFFEILGVSTDYEASDLVYPSVQWTADSSPLHYSELGLLECRGQAWDDTLFSVPYETWGDRLGYVFIGVDCEARKARIHGFMPQINQTDININHLQSVEEMIRHLDHITQPIFVRDPVCLSDWLCGLFQPGWETLESIFPMPNSSPGWAFRGTLTAPLEPLPQSEDIKKEDAEKVVRRAKVLRWNPSPENSSEFPPDLVLVVEIHPQDEVLVQVVIQMHSANPSSCLPPNLLFKIVDTQQQSILQARSRAIDNYLHFPFRGNVGEIFQVNITVDGFEINECFQI